MRLRKMHPVKCQVPGYLLRRHISYRDDIFFRGVPHECRVDPRHLANRPDDMPTQGTVFEVDVFSDAAEMLMKLFTQLRKVVIRISPTLPIRLSDGGE